MRWIFGLILSFVCFCVESDSHEKSLGSLFAMSANGIGCRVESSLNNSFSNRLKRRTQRAGIKNCYLSIYNHTNSNIALDLYGGFLNADHSFALSDGSEICFPIKCFRNLNIWEEVLVPKGRVKTILLSYYTDLSDINPVYKTNTIFIVDETIRFNYRIAGSKREKYLHIYTKINDKNLVINKVEDIELDVKPIRRNF